MKKRLNITDGKSFETDGMRLRDYFAAKAMQGLYSPEIMYQSEARMKAEIEHAAKTAYIIADAMLKERNKTKQK